MKLSLLKLVIRIGKFWFSPNSSSEDLIELLITFPFEVLASIPILPFIPVISLFFHLIKHYEAMVAQQFLKVSKLSPG